MPQVHKYFNFVRNYMFKYILTFILFITSSDVKAQEQVFKYKNVADKLIRTHFDTSLIPIIQCKTFVVENNDRESGYGSSGTFEYDKEKFKREGFTSIIFNYFFYSPSLKDTLRFRVVLDPKKKVIYKNFFEGIPQCVRKNSMCKFISKDSAVSIAKADLIRYPNSLTINFEQSPYRRDFYWVLMGEPKDQKARISRMKGGASGYGAFDYRYINAETGEVISRLEFFKRR
jgi:hypothetical protein